MTNVSYVLVAYYHDTGEMVLDIDETEYRLPKSGIFDTEHQDWVKVFDKSILDVDNFFIEKLQKMIDEYNEKNKEQK